MNIERGNSIFNSIDMDSMNLILDDLTTSKLLKFGSTCYDAQHLISKRIAKIIGLQFGEDQSIIYKDVSLKLNWDFRIIKEGFK